jgi:hypothetical protein
MAASWLSAADEQVLQVARLIVNEGRSFIEATTQAGAQWSERTFGQNVNRLLTNPALRRALGSASRRMLGQAVRTVGGEALAAVSAEALAAATAFIGISTTALLTGAAILVGLGLVGGYMWSRGDKPIQPGPAMSRQHTDTSGLVGREVTYHQDPYFVFLLPRISGGSIYVGQESVLKNTPGCRMPGGGLCQGNDPPVDYEKKAGPFKTHEAATEAWCKEFGRAAAAKQVAYWPVAHDSKAQVYGGSYWVGTAPGCPS